jgi:hypothetical protein
VIVQRVASAAVAARATGPALMPAKTLGWLAATRKMQTAKANARRAKNAPAHGMKTAANAGATGAASAVARAARTVMHRRMAKPPFQNHCWHTTPRQQKQARTIRTQHPAMAQGLIANAPRPAKCVSAAAATATDATATPVAIGHRATQPTWARP